MLYLLIALQLSSTNCIADAAGVIHCTTLSTPQIQAPPIPKKSGSSCALCNLISIFDGSAKKRHAKAVGNMLAKGDCVGAERYALQKGDSIWQIGSKRIVGRLLTPEQVRLPQHGGYTSRRRPPGAHFIQTSDPCAKKVATCQLGKESCLQLPTRNERPGP